MITNTRRYRPAARGALFAAAAMFLLSVSVMPAARADEGAAAAKKILEQSVAALGGMKATTGWKTSRMISIRPGWGTLEANVTESIKKPNKMKIDQDFSAYDNPFFFIYYYNDGDVWVNVNLGIRQHPRYTEQLTKMMRRIDGLGYFLSSCDTFYVVQDVPDDSLIAGSSIERVGVVDDGDTLLFDIDTATHLPVRRIEERGATQLLMDDYRDVAGMKVPFHVTGYHSGEKAAEYFWKTIEFDKPIDDAIFEEDRPKKEESQ
jgi:hypothetical protein